MPVIHRKLPELTPQDLQRFCSKFQIGLPDDCWFWQAGRDEDGYGVFWMKPNNIRASRIAYSLHYGTDPASKMVCHICDNPPCCNPKHFFLGTCRDNVADAIKKGRAKINGEDNGFSKLTEAAVKDIRARYTLHKGRWEENPFTLQFFANLYGVSTTQIHDVVKRRVWKHI